QQECSIQQKDKPPAMKHTLEDASCPKSPADWRDLGGDFCYYFDLKNLVNWVDASFLCLRRGGTLGGIHSPEESQVLQNFLKFVQTKEYFKRHYLHIGLHRDFRDVEFAWADGQHYDYQNWDHNEGINEQEYCVVVNSYEMKWHDVGCPHQAGYICTVRKVPAFKVLKAEVASKEVLNQTMVNTTPIYSGYSTTSYVATIIGVLLISGFVGVCASEPTVFSTSYCVFRKFKQEMRFQMHYRKYEGGSGKGLEDENMYANVI
ncbi:hypothetical protein JTE90_021984, partial [Oedothorax gibbosus]